MKRSDSIQIRIYFEPPIFLILLLILNSCCFVFWRPTEAQKKMVEKKWLRLTRSYNKIDRKDIYEKIRFIQYNY
jgi:hypothetical protein